MQTRHSSKTLGAASSAIAAALKNQSLKGTVMTSRAKVLVARVDDVRSVLFISDAHQLMNILQLRRQVKVNSSFVIAQRLGNLEKKSSSKTTKPTNLEGVS